MQNLHKNAHSSIFLIAVEWKKPTCLSTDEATNKMWTIQTLEHYLAIKRNEASIHATVWTNPENIMFREKPDTKEHIFMTALQ